MPTRQGDHEAQHHGTTQKKDFKDALTFFVWRVRRFLGRRRERERKKKEKIEKSERPRGVLSKSHMAQSPTWANGPTPATQKKKRKTQVSE